MSLDTFLGCLPPLQVPKSVHTSLRGLPNTKNQRGAPRSWVPNNDFARSALSAQGVAPQRPTLILRVREAAERGVRTFGGLWRR